MAARVDAAAVTSNPRGRDVSPLCVDSSGKALVAIGTASTAKGTTNTAHANP